MANFPWPTESVADSLQPLMRLPTRKLNTSEYKDAGAYPIVDQGQGLIAGWTDDPGAVITEPLPLIVFGDHTRIFKFVDFRFARGADGTQLLRPRAGIDPLFFFYACRSIDLPSRGYNRHFSILKEKTVPIPAEEFEQQRIATVLHRLETSVRDHAVELTVLDELKHATMRELFTRGLRGQDQKESEIGPIPESWGVVGLGSLGRIGNGSTPKRDVKEYWEGGYYPWLTSAKVYDRLISAADEFVTDEALARCHLPRVQAGSLVMAITGQGKTLGNCALLGIEATVSQHLAYVSLNSSEVTGSYVRGYLETRYGYLRDVASGGGSTKGALTCAFLRELPIPLPPTRQEQQEIADVLDAIDQKIDLHQQKRAVLEELFRTLLHKLMTGKVRVSDLDLSALETVPAAEVTV